MHFFILKHSRAILCLLLLCLALHAEAQQSYNLRQQMRFNKQLRSNFTITQSDGLGSLMVDSRLTSPTRLGFATRLDFGYTYLWSRTNGIHTGLGLAYLGGGMRSGRVESSAMGEIEIFNNERRDVRRTHFTAITTDVAEHWDALFLAIPLQMVFQDDHFYLNAGLRFFLPLSVSSSYSYGATTVGVGYALDGVGSEVPLPVEVDRLADERGRYTLSSLSGGGLAYLGYATLSLEGGQRLALDDKQMVILGGYIDFALNRTPIGGPQPMAEIVDGNLRRRPAMQSQLASHLRYISFGIQATYSFTFGKRIGFRRGNPFRLSREHAPLVFISECDLNPICLLSITPDSQKPPEIPENPKNPKPL
ncbi:MAG: hypothetical protein IJ620_03270 [Bacteroidales bacterium]|nr:hypothetical protein [Bacteroidales bacterium]